MKKKFLSFLGVLAFVLTAGICFAGCTKAVNIQGTVNLEFEDFDDASYSNSVFCTCAAGPASPETINTETGYKFTYGPEKTKIRSEITVEISIYKIYSANLVISEKDNKPFTKRILPETLDNNYWTIRIVIPYAQTIDYTFKISKPEAQINQVDFNFDSDIDFNDTKTEVRDFLDHSQIFVENADVDSFGRAVAGFVPLVVGESGQKQFNLAGKYINVDMTQEQFTLYLKYDNNGNQIPFAPNTLRFLFDWGDSMIRPDVHVAEFKGESVYAFNFDTNEVMQYRTLSLKQSGLLNLIYLDATINDHDTASVNLFDEHLTEDLIYTFSLVGWKQEVSQEWQQSPLPRKTYGQKIYLKYKFDNIVGLDASITEQELIGLTDFNNIKFQISGMVVKNLQYIESEKAYTFEIDEFDTPETYSKELSTIFNIGVDPRSINIKSDAQNVKDVTFSSLLELWRTGNKVLSELAANDGTSHAWIYSGSNEYNPNIVEFALNDLGRYQSFTLSIVLDGKTYTKEFVYGRDFLIKQQGEGDLLGAYLFEPQTEYVYLPQTNGTEDNLIHYHFSFDINHQNQLVLSIEAATSRTELKVLLTDVTYHTLDIEVGGDVYDQEYFIYDEGNLSLDLHQTDIRADFDLTEMFDNNFEIKIAVYSNDLLLFCNYVYNTNSESISNIEGYYIDGMRGEISSYSSDPDISLRFFTNGVATLYDLDDNQTKINVAITKIVVTINAIND